MTWGKRTADEEICLLSLGTDEMMRDVFPGSLFQSILTGNQNPFIHVCHIKTSIPT